LVIFLYIRIFTIAPEAQGLFKFAKDAEPMAEAIFSHPEFKKHARKVISTVNTAVGMLEPNLDGLVVILKGLGKSHKGYGIVDAHYPVVGEALIGTLSDALGDAFTSDVKAAWVEVYGVISSTMLAGAAEE
jgi:hemoglobin-like flavoprotein